MENEIKVEVIEEGVEAAEVLQKGSKKGLFIVLGTVVAAGVAGAVLYLKKKHSKVETEEEVQSEDTETSETEEFTEV